MIMRSALVSATTFLAVALPGPSFSAQEQIAGDAVQVYLNGNVHNTTLSVSGPDGYYAESFAQAGIPMIRLSQHGSLADGVYRWQVTAATDETVSVRDNGLDDGRGSEARTSINKGMYESGMFRVQNGVILPTTGAIEQ
jgi:hypothetical protein